jgi:hypothetical protein
MEKGMEISSKVQSRDAEACMIKYDGIRQLSDDTYLIMFSRFDGGGCVAATEVPVDRLTAERILKYLERISLPVPKKVEPQNDEPND